MAKRENHKSINFDLDTHHLNEVFGMGTGSVPIPKLNGLCCITTLSTGSIPVMYL